MTKGPLDDMHKRVTETGRRAYVAGLKPRDNPFSHGSECRKWWQAGYRDAGKRAIAAGEVRNGYGVYAGTADNWEVWHEVAGIKAGNAPISGHATSDDAHKARLKYELEQRGSGR